MWPPAVHFTSVFCKDFVFITVFLTFIQKGDVTEEGVTSEEFDKFLEERAKAADTLPSPPGANTPHPPRPSAGSHKKAERTEDALFAL